MTDKNNNGNQWEVWSKYVLKNIEEIKSDMKEQGDILRGIDRRLTVMEVKAATYGAAAAAIISIVIHVIKTKIGG